MAITFSSDPSDTLVYDAIVRIAAILKTIPDPSNTGDYIDASDTFWDPSSIFPRFYVKFAGMQTVDDGSLAGGPIYVDTLQFLIRLVVGTLSSGVITQRETDVNILSFQVLRRFRYVPQLNDPTTGAPLRYLQKPFSHIVAIPNGSRGITFEQNGPVFMGQDFLLNVTVRTETGRFLGQPGG